MNITFHAVVAEYKKIKPANLKVKLVDHWKVVNGGDTMKSGIADHIWRKKWEVTNPCGMMFK